MTIHPLQTAGAAGRADQQNSPETAAVEQAARNRELARAVKAINDHEAFGSSSELRFAIDRETGRGLIRIVDRATNEVLNQIPPEEVLRLAAEFGRQSARGHLA